MLERIDRITADIDGLSGVIETSVPDEEQPQQAESMPGWAAAAAQDAIAETGVDMSRSATGADLVLLGSRAPLDHQSVPQGRAKTRRATGTWPDAGETAIAVSRTETREAAATAYRPRRGKPRPRSPCNTSSKSCPAAVEPRMRDEDLGRTYPERRADLRRDRPPIGQSAPGFEVTLRRIPDPDDGPGQHKPPDRYRPRRP